jgi:hypothetical protein
MWLTKESSVHGGEFGAPGEVEALQTGRLREDVLQALVAALHIRSIIDDIVNKQTHITHTHTSHPFIFVYAKVYLLVGLLHHRLRTSSVMMVEARRLRCVIFSTYGVCLQ